MATPLILADHVRSTLDAFHGTLRALRALRDKATRGDFDALAAALHQDIEPEATWQWAAALDFAIDTFAQDLAPYEKTLLKQIAKDAKTKNPDATLEVAKRDHKPAKCPQRARTHVVLGRRAPRPPLPAASPTEGIDIEKEVTHA